MPISASKLLSISRPITVEWPFMLGTFAVGIVQPSMCATIPVQQEKCKPPFTSVT